MTNNNYKRSEIANVIALHDIEVLKPNDFKNWLESIVKFLQLHGLEPTRIGITGDKYSKSKNTILFKNGVKKLYENNFEQLEAITINIWDSNEENIGFAWCESRIKPKKNTILLTFDDEIVKWDHDLMNKLAKDLASFVRPKYGYCFQREWKKGPEWYPFGYLKGIDAFDDPEGDDIWKWNQEYNMPDGDYKTGDLRDIYPMNIICDEHLKRKVASQTLKEWIESSAKHGKLELLNKDTYAWWVDEENIEYVREELRPTGMILCI